MSRLRHSFKNGIADSQQGDIRLQGHDFVLAQILAEEVEEIFQFFDA